MQRERGFTLIELLVVIAILAVLFGLTALALNSVGDNAEAVAAEAEADMVQTAIDVWMTIEGTDEITATVGAEQAGDGADISDATFDTYIRRESRYCFTWQDDGEVTAALDCDDSTQLWP